MKITVVPAQVTTVEDRIMGNLSFSQMILVIAPIFISAALFTVLPPMLGSSPYKYIIIACIGAVFGILAIRVRGKIIALWLAVILRYNLRPTYYLFNKNTSSQRTDYAPSQKSDDSPTAQTEEHQTNNKLALHDAARAMAALENPSVQLQFKTSKKGGLYVRLTEIKD